MTNENQPLDQRTQTLTDYRALIDWLAANPDAPVDRWGDPLTYSVTNEVKNDDAAGLARIAEISAALGIPITGNSGEPVKPGAAHHYVRKTIGRAQWHAVYIVRADMEEYAENQRWIADRRKAAES